MYFRGCVMSYKAIDDLVEHLNENGISISGSAEKRQLLNTGYYHGYKGYRFFGTSQRKIPFKSYKEVYATIVFDSKLKALFYDKLMYIETAVRNIALVCILNKTKSESIQTMYDTAIENYNTNPDLPDKKRREIQENKLSLQNTIQSNILSAYKSSNPKITHFYHNMNYSGVPIWALFEVLTMGDFGKLLSCLTYDVRDAISKELGLNTSVDTNRELIYRYIYLLKDLRNAVAHNAVIFDTRFKRFKPSAAMEQCMNIEFHLPYIHFDKIDDYIILVSYYLKILHYPQSDIKHFISSYEDIVEEYKKSVNMQVSNMVIHPDLTARINTVKNFI